MACAAEVRCRERLFSDYSDTRQPASASRRYALATTEVTWLMRGPAPFVTKLMSVFVDMDKMIGKDFEAGLANLKAAAEK